MYFLFFNRLEKFKYYKGNCIKSTLYFVTLLCVHWQPLKMSYLFAIKQNL